MDYLFFGIVVFGIGFLVGWWLRGRDAPKQNRRPFEVYTAPNHLVRLHFIGTLDEKLSKWLANRILDGYEFSGPSLQSKWDRGGRLSPKQYEGVRDELVSRHMASRTTQKRVVLHPPAYAFFRMLAGRRKEGTRKVT